MRRRKEAHVETTGKSEGFVINARVKQNASMPDEESDEEDLRAQVRNDVNEENLLNMEIPPMPGPIMSADGSGQRLMITSIVVENFKSYYGRHVLGPFHQNFSAVIGPNGSGKSNVIDSLLFVFGYRASKIRSKKISVLIHSSAGRENIPSCTVGVHFQKIIDLPDGSYDVVSGSQFTVTRSAFRDNSSKYTYNGKTIQFKDIAALLRDVGIDLIHNRFLILQGEVEQIALMKPKALNENDDGMLEYLEDIIGSSRLKVPIEKIQQKVDQLQEDRSAQLNRLKFAEKEKNDAEGPMKNLIAELRIDNGIALAKNRLLQAERFAASTEMQEDKMKKDELEKSLEVVKERQEEIFALQRNRKGEQKELQKVFEKAQEAYEKAKHQLSESEHAERKRKAELLRLKEKKKKLLDEIAKEGKKIAELEKAPERARCKLEEYKKILNGIDDEIAQKQAEVDSRLKELQEQTAEFQELKKALEEQVGKLTAKEDEASSKLTLAQEALHLLQRDEEIEKKKLAELQASHDDAKILLESKKSEVFKLQQVIQNVDKELHDAVSEMTEKRKEEAECVENVRQCIAKFEQKKQTVETSRSQNNVLRQLMAEKASGNIPGIYGRLGDLGAIDEKYDVAISTTCRPLDYIVVDNVDTAQICVEFLRRENLGIASFLVLDKQEKLRPYMIKPSSTPENAPRLFDLIRVADPAVLPAFYFALRDTLVVDDITTATRISMSGKDRYRVVTLKGEVVETSGSMTGGGRSERRGRIGQSVKVDTSKDSAKEVIELQKLLNNEKNRLNDLRHVIQQLDSRMTSLQNDCDRLKRNERNLTSDIDSLERKIADLKHRLKEQALRANNATVDEQTVQRKKAEIVELEKVHDKASKVANEMRERVADINSQIQEVYDRVVGPYQKELDETQAKKESASKGATKEQSTLNNAQRNMNKALSRINEKGALALEYYRKNDFEMDLCEMENAVKKLEMVEENYTANIDALTKEKLQHERLMKEAEAKVKEALTNNTELDAEELELKRKYADLTRAFSEQSKLLKIKEEKIAAFQNKIESLRLCYVKYLDRLPESIQTNEEENGDYAIQEALHVEHDFFKKLRTGEIAVEADKDGVVRYKSMPIYSEVDISNFNLQDIKFRLANLEKRKVGKVLNTNGLLEYITKLERYDREAEALADISTKRDKHRQFCEQLKKQRMNEFMDGFTRIGLALKEMYQMITLGGDASLDLVDSLDPFSEGVSFGVRPPKKSWKQITNLSGGEKTLSSLALVFALHHYRPTPLYVMDEIDAALDFRNVSIIGHYIKDRTKNAQFIIISLRNNMFELADRLIGIYKTFDCTKSVAIDPDTVQITLKPFHVLEEFKKRKQQKNEMHPVEKSGPLELSNSEFVEHGCVLERKKTSLCGTKASTVASDNLSLPSNQDNECGSVLEKRKHPGCFRKNNQCIEKCVHPSESHETTPALSISPPIKKKSPRKPGVSGWDVPDTITVRRSQSGPVDNQLHNDDLDAKNPAKSGSYDSSGVKDMDTVLDVSPLEKGNIEQQKNQPLSATNSVSDTDRLEQFARML